MEASSDPILGSDLSRTVVGSNSWSSPIARSIREIAFRICAAVRFGACGGEGERELAIDYLITGLNLPLTRAGTAGVSGVDPRPSDRKVGTGIGTEHLGKGRDNEG